MRWYIIAALLFLCLAITPLTGYSQQIEGIVMDERTGEPLPGANLYFKNNRSLGATTAVDGTFVLITDHAMPSDTVIISFVGYKTLSLLLSVLRSTKTIKLSSSSEEIQEIIIRAERLISEEFNVKKISRIGIYKNPSANADPLLAVNSLPSATTTDESANVSFRGSSANETGIFFNDVPIYDAVRFAGLNGIGTFSIFNTSIVKDVVVFPGNPPLEYGNTTAGVISIYTNNAVPSLSQNSAVVSLASFGFNRYQRLGKRSGLTFFSNYSPSAIIRSLNTEALRDILKFRSNDLGMNFSHQLDDRTHLNIFNYAISEGYTFRFQDPTYTGEFKQKRKRNFSVFNLKRTFSNSSIALNAGYSISELDFNYSRAVIDTRNRDYFLGFNYQYYGKKSDLKLGFSLDDRKQRFSGDVPEFDFAIGLEHPLIFVEAQNSVAVPELYAYYKYTFSEQWTVGLGSRKNVFNEKIKGYWSFQGNLHYKPSKYLQVIMGLGQYHRNQLGRNDGAPELLTSKQVSVDIKYKRNRWEQSLSLFHKSNRSHVDTEISGIEYYADVKLGAKTKIQLSVNAISARATNEELTYSTPFDVSPFIKGAISRDFPFGISAAANFLWREGTPFLPIIGASFNPFLNAYEPQRVGLDEQERLGAYKKINLTVSKLHPISEKLTLIYFASVNNVFDAKNERAIIHNFDYSSSSPQYFARRSLYFGASINF